MFICIYHFILINLSFCLCTSVYVFSTVFPLSVLLLCDERSSLGADMLDDVLMCLCSNWLLSLCSNNRTAYRIFACPSQSDCVFSFSSYCLLAMHAFLPCLLCLAVILVKQAIVLMVCSSWQLHDLLLTVESDSVISHLFYYLQIVHFCIHVGPTF